MTTAELWAKVDRMMDLMILGFMFPIRVRLGVRAFELAGEFPTLDLPVDILVDPQLLPNEVVLDADGLEGGFDEDCLNIVSKRRAESAEAMLAGRHDTFWPVFSSYRGNRPKYKGIS